MPVKQLTRYSQVTHVCYTTYMTTIAEYLAAIQPQQKAEIERLMALVRQHVPDAKEEIAYGMPAFKYKAKPLIYFGAFKNHMSIFPTAGPTADETLVAKLKDYVVSKGTIQFTLEHPVTDRLVLDLLSHRIKTIDQA